MTKLLILLLLLFYSSHQYGLAQHFSSNNYNIDWGNFNMTSGRKTSTNYSLTDTVGQNAPGEYSKTGVRLKSGFQYIYPFDVFSFSIDSSNIDFGTLTSNIGSTIISILTTTTPSGLGYQITASESGPLKQESGIIIPDFIGDNNLASELISDTWNNSNTYGFGFNANTSYFSSSNHFRQFANKSSLENAQIIDSSNTPVNNHQTNITYKINVGPNQSSGKYQNYVIYTATPKY